MGSSFANSLGTWLYTGGKTPISISFGAVTYDFTNKSWNYLAKQGNTLLQNVGLALGAFAKISDALAGIHPVEVQIQIENCPEDGQPDLIGHVQVLTTDGESLIDFGPTGDFYGFDPGRNDWIPYASDNRLTQVIQIPGNINRNGIIIKGVNVSRLQSISERLNANPGFYNFALRSCSSVAARSLTISGVPMYGLHPYLLQAQAFFWNLGLRPWSYCYYTL